MMVSGSADQRKEQGSLVNDPIFAAAAIALESDSSLAFSTIIPTFAAHSRPLPDMVDVAADTAIEERRQQSDTPQSAALSTDQSHWVEAYEQYAVSRTASDQRRAAFLRMMPAENSNSQNLTGDKPQNASQTTLLKVLATHSQLHSFQALLQPTGFQRPGWQTVSKDAMLVKPDIDVEPFVVMIDPGHGGTDQGAKGHNGLLEKDLTLDIARRIRLALTEFKHIDVKLTRNHDYGLSRHARVNAIKRGNADMVISLHFNHLPQTDINLVESYFAGPANIQQSLAAKHQKKHTEGHGSMHRTIGSTTNDIDLGFTEGSARLADTLHEHLFAEVSVNDHGVQNAGVKEETFFVLTQSFIPGVLMELSCLSHEPEAQRLEHNDYRNRLAQALVDGIREYHDSLQRAPLRKRGDVGA